MPKGRQQAESIIKDESRESLILACLSEITIHDLAKIITEFTKFTSEDLERVTKTSAKADWCLSDKDLIQVEYIECKNPHYRSASPMLLYQKFDLDQVVIQKYGSHQGLKIELEKRRQRRIKRRDNMSKNIDKKYNERKDTLVQALAERCLELRSDSNLCDEYLEGKRNDLEFIVSTMEEMNFYYNCTDYEDLLEQTIEEEKEEIRRYSYHDLRHRECPGERYEGPHWDFDECSDTAKSMALRQFVKEYLKTNPKESIDLHVPASLLECVEYLLYPKVEKSSLNKK